MIKYNEIEVTTKVFEASKGYLKVLVARVEVGIEIVDLQAATEFCYLVVGPEHGIALLASTMICQR